MKKAKLTAVEKRQIRRDAGLLTIVLSTTSKMPCRSWSTVARKHCPGSRTRDQLTGAMIIAAACIVCYADSGHYLHTSTRLVREFNATEWQHPDFTQGMIAAIAAEGVDVFRFFDSGDVYDIKLARKLYLIMLFSPNTDFWLPTRSHKLAKFAAIFDAMNNLPNCVVRYSSDSVTGRPIATDTPQSVIYGDVAEIPEGAFQCKAYNGKESTPTCGSCRECWNPKTKIVAYAGHGAKFAKVHKAEKAKELETIQVLELA
jgi:hypothetical protein